MGHLVAREPWGVVDLGTTDGRVFVQQDWFYIWSVVPPASPWTHPEKQHFHNTLDRHVWAQWSDRLRIYPTGAHELARRFGTSGLRLTFDVHWVTRPGHWTVTVRKLVPGGNYRSNVTFATRTIELDSEDLTPHVAANDAGQTGAGFRTGPHEFGHTIRNPDEYNRGAANLADTTSVMNIGQQLRPRHAQLITETLHKLVPACMFRAN
jgi:hypothetical protein